MLNGLAFVPLDDIKAAIRYLRTVMPPSAEALVQYFDENFHFVSGSVYATWRPVSAVCHLDSPRPPGICTLPRCLMATGRTIIPKGGTNHYNIWSATRNRQSRGCSRRCRPILLRRQQNYFAMLWARCRRKRRRKLLQRHGSDCALNMSMAVVT